MAPSRRSADDRPALAVRVKTRLLELDRGWWATLIGLAVVALAWIVP